MSTRRALIGLFINLAFVALNLCFWPSPFNVFVAGLCTAGALDNLLSLWFGVEA